MVQRPTQNQSVHLCSSAEKPVSHRREMTASSRKRLSCALTVRANHAAVTAAHPMRQLIFGASTRLGSLVMKSARIECGKLAALAICQSIANGQVGFVRLPFGAVISCTPNARRARERTCVRVIARASNVQMCLTNHHLLHTGRGPLRFGRCVSEHAFKPGTHRFWKQRAHMLHCFKCIARRGARKTHTPS